MTEPILQAIGISKNFGALVASKDVSMTLLPGEIHAVIGPNGAGKSTLIKQICGSLSPDQGSVHFLGQNVTAKSTQSRARLGLGRTFQISSLAMEDTVLQNTILGAYGAAQSRLGLFSTALKNEEMREQALAALERVSLISETTKQVSELSHGQRRQLEIAIALTMQPKAFIMDEPMAGLGVSGSKQITELLDGLREQAPILLVEHDMDAVFSLADRISVLVYGEIIATGNAKEIQINPRVREAYLGHDL